MQAAEFTVAETHGFGALESVKVSRTSEGLGWAGAYLSAQTEQPYAKRFNALADVLVGVITVGPIKAGVEIAETVHNVRGPSRSIGIIPDQVAFKVDLQTTISTIHLYLRRSLLEEVGERIYRGDPSTIALSTELAVFDPVIEQLVTAARDALDEDAKFSALYVDHILAALAAYLVRKRSNAGSRRRHSTTLMGLNAKQLDRTRALIEERLGGRLTLADLAAEAGMGADHFGRLFKRATGLSLYQFVIRCRVDRARNLLIETAMPITEIALECGFADQVHLTRAFGRATGTTPAAFRRENQRRMVFVAKR